jgi:antitoxin (DNA-binding transcriptional repressor) of toxin-antitoxin stability system
MPKVGLRQLKNRLSHYVRQVRRGHELQVTDRGEVVAELVRPRQGPAAGGRDGLASLARRGLVTLGLPNDPKVYRRKPKLLKPGELQRLIDEERGER